MFLLVALGFSNLIPFDRIGLSFLFNNCLEERSIYGGVVELFESRLWREEIGKSWEAENVFFSCFSNCNEIASSGKSIRVSLIRNEMRSSKTIKRENILTICSSYFVKCSNCYLGTSILFIIEMTLGCKWGFLKIKVAVSENRLL